MMTWFLYALGAALIFAAWNLLSRILTVKSNDPRTFSVIYNVLAGVLAVFFFVLPQSPLKPLSPVIIILTIAATLIWGLYARIEFYATKHVEASVLTIFGKLSPLITFFLSVLIFHEGVSGQKIIAALLITGGNLLVVYKHQGLKFDKGIKYALATAVLLGVGWVFDKYLISYYPAALYVMGGYLLPALYVAVAPPISLKVAQQEFKRAPGKILLLASCGAAGYFCLLKALSLAEASRVILVSSTATIITIAMSILFLKEREHIGTKIVAGMLVFIGVVLIG